MVDVDLDPADVVDRVAAAGDDAHDLVEPGLARSDVLQRGAGDEAAVLNREQRGVQQRPVGVVERTVQEDRDVVALRPPHRAATIISMASSMSCNDRCWGAKVGAST